MKAMCSKLMRRGCKLCGYNGFGERGDVSVMFFKGDKEYNFGGLEWDFVENLFDEIEEIKKYRD